MNLNELNRTELLGLYNEAALRLEGRKTLKSFKDKPTAVKRTRAIIAEVGPAKSKADTIASNPVVIKRLTRRQCATIEKLSTPADNDRLKFWGNYQNGMTVRHIVETAGLDDTHVRYWIKLGHMRLLPADEAEYQSARTGFAQ